MPRCRNLDGSPWSDIAGCLNVVQADELEAWAAKVYVWAIAAERLCRDPVPDHGSVP